MGTIAAHVYTTENDYLMRSCKLLAQLGVQLGVIVLDIPLQSSVDARWTVLCLKQVDDCMDREFCVNLLSWKAQQ